MDGWKERERGKVGWRLGNAEEGRGKGDEMYVVAVNGCICSCRIGGENSSLSSKARTLISLRKEASAPSYGFLRQGSPDPIHSMILL